MLLFSQFLSHVFAGLSGSNAQDRDTWYVKVYPTLTKRASVATGPLSNSLCIFVFLLGTSIPSPGRLAHVGKVGER